MTELVEKVKEAKKLLTNSQKELLSWCRDRNAAPLNERFDVWQKYVDKSKHSYIGCGKESKILSDLIDFWTDKRDLERHQTIDWGWILEGLGEDFSEERNKTKILAILNKHKQIARDIKIGAVLSNVVIDQNVTGLNVISDDDFSNLLSEELMVANFGSFEFDW